ncbi:hypothetical protein WS72_07220 [Burkholderia savannae]|uniref:Uncharacterized protein n=1 Tax=Burkholderia savannae TaxID=1637837 RepID=A0ABR5TCF2_9BURK|nr:hypothetical protein WS72_07220 [Burkholderia savannae]
MIACGHSDSEWSCEQHALVVTPAVAASAPTPAFAKPFLFVRSASGVRRSASTTHARRICSRFGDRRVDARCVWSVCSIDFGQYVE